MEDVHFEDLYRDLVNAVSALSIEGYDGDAIVEWCQDIITAKRESAKNLYEAAIVDATQKYIKAVYPRKVESYPVDELRLYARKAIIDVVDQHVSLTKFLPLTEKL